MEGKEQAKSAPSQKSKDGMGAESKSATPKQQSATSVKPKTNPNEVLPGPSVKKKVSEKPAETVVQSVKSKSAIPEQQSATNAKPKTNPQEVLPGPSVRKKVSEKPAETPKTEPPPSRGRADAKKPGAEAKNPIPETQQKEEGRKDLAKPKSKESTPKPVPKKEAEERADVKPKDSDAKLEESKAKLPVKKDGESEGKSKVPRPSPVSSLTRETARSSIWKLKSLFPKQFQAFGIGEPKPLQLLSVNNDHTFELNEEELTPFLLRDDVKDLHVVIVSVAGAFRKGKSFLLDFFLRYLRAKGAPEWMGDENSPLTGFVWRGGCERNTSGILIWNEIFRVMTPSGEVGVILMDTQGSFDSGSTVRDCATIFALSTMTSSVQVYNLSQNIQEDDLQHLQLFTEYGRLALAEGDYEGTPFQKLVFLVRDWSYPYEASYGREGGKQLLERRLEVNEMQHEELQILREHIRKCFASLDCFLLPHPGLIVATAPQFDGRSKDIDKEFLKQIEILVPYLLAPENLSVKEINGRKVTCQELLEYIRAYVKVFGSNELPEPKSILVATFEATNLAAVAVCREYYNVSMNELCGGHMPYINPDDLEAHHQQCRESTKAKFEDTRKMGGEDFSLAYLEKLLADLDECYEGFVKQNDRKNIFTAMKTPASLITAVVGSYFASSVFNLFRISSIANLCNFVTGFLTSVTVAWSYIRYTGEYPDVGQTIEKGVDLLHGHVLKPIGDIASPKLLGYLSPPRRRSEMGTPSSSVRFNSSVQVSPKKQGVGPKTPGKAMTSPRKLVSRPTLKR